MFSSAARAAARPIGNTTTRCIRQHRTQSIQKLLNEQRPCQRRFQSTEGRRARPEKGRFWPNFITLWRAHPYSVSTALATIAFGFGALVYANHIYNAYIIAAFHNFPEPVAKELRKALYYTNQDLKPKEALKFYKKALAVAEEIGMDPFSDEIIGVKIQLAAFMEKIEQYGKAIEVLEIVKRDNLKWIEMFGDRPHNVGKRSKILAKTIAVATKLGELYSCEQVRDKEAAEEQLVWAVENALKELHRRNTEGVKEGEGEWMTTEEIGASMEALGNHYEEKNQHYLATPLYLQAINLSPPKSCHTAVLMNNLSISLAQQDPPATPGQAPVSRSALVANAREWAKKSISVAALIAPADGRTEECDMACAVATHNLGEFAEMDGNIAEARLKYEEAKSLSKVLGFQEGVDNAQAGLDRVGGL